MTERHAWSEDYASAHGLEMSFSQKLFWEQLIDNLPVSLLPFAMSPSLLSGQQQCQSTIGRLQLALSVRPSTNARPQTNAGISCNRPLSGKRTISTRRPATAASIILKPESPTYLSNSHCLAADINRSCELRRGAFD